MFYRYTLLPHHSAYGYKDASQQILNINMHLFVPQMNVFPISFSCMSFYDFPGKLNKKKTYPSLKLFVHVVTITNHDIHVYNISALN